MANGIVLSILIPTIVGREEQFNRLYQKLTGQLAKYGIWNEIEVVTECDDRTMSIGNKRQLLMDKCYGDFVTFIDDDDDIPDDYCLTIWTAIHDNPDADCIGFLQTCIMDGWVKSACLSNQFSVWQPNVDGFDYVRTPFFPTPIRRRIAMEIRYADLRYGEDHDFSIRLKESGLIKKEHFINKAMYIYQYTTKPFNEKYGHPEK